MNITENKQALSAGDRAALDLVRLCLASPSTFGRRQPEAIVDGELKDVDDGKVWTTDVGTLIRIRTGERGSDAV